MTGILALFGLFTGLILRPQSCPYEQLNIQPILTGVASYYDYELNGITRSKYHRTCAFHHQYKDYKMYKVCNIENDKCVECFNNDRMRREDRVVDLSSFAFSLIGSKKRGLIQVEIYEISPSDGDEL